MHHPSEKPPVPDQETLEYVQAVFDLVRGGDAERLGDLLGRGLPANLLNQRGDSLLMLASYHGHLEAARQLLEHGADPELRNDQGQTPLLGAVFKGNAPMAQLLLAHGADVESAGPEGRTALMMAAMFNRTEMVELLLAHGADLRARDRSGLSVLDAARIMGAPDTAAQLEQKLGQGMEAAPTPNPPYGTSQGAGGAPADNRARPGGNSMTDDRRDNGTTNTDSSRAEGGSSTEGTVNDTSSLDTTLGTSRTGGMGGMAGTMDVDTDMAGTAPAGELEDL